MAVGAVERSDCGAEGRHGEGLVLSCCDVVGLSVRGFEVCEVQGGAGENAVHEKGTFLS